MLDSRLVRHLELKRSTALVAVMSRLGSKGHGRRFNGQTSCVEPTRLTAAKRRLHGQENAFFPLFSL